MSAAEAGSPRRFTAARPCPICGGHDRLQRGQGTRCGGFLSSDGAYAHCTREERAGTLTQERGGTFAHRLAGRCRCGATHGSAPPPARRRAGPERSKIVATYDYTDENGELLYQAVRREPKGFQQRRPNGRGGWEWKLGSTRRVLYRLPEVVAAAAAGNRIYVCEGEKDVEAVRAAGHVATCNPMGACKWRAEYADHLDGAEVLIVEDQDDEGRKHAQQVLESLTGRAASVSIVRPAAGKDAADHLAAGHTVDEFVPAHAKTAASILVSDRQMEDVINDAVDALRANNEPPVLFYRGAETVRVIRDEDERGIIVPAGIDGVLEQLYPAATWLRMTERTKDIVPAEPTRKLATAVSIRLLDRGNQLPALSGVISAPTLRADGSILSAEGYDAQSRLYLALEPGLIVPPVPEAPSHLDVESAVALIDEVLVDFPFVDASDRASAFALLFTIALRESIRGCTPLICATATQQGSGKTLAVQAIATIATGRAAAPSAMPDGRSAEDELRKRILSTLRGGRRVCVLDNITRPIDSPSLAGLITATRWTDRVLGQSIEIDLPNATTWIATGNNLRVRGDFARRTVWIRLNAKHAQPWTRAGFRHSDLLAYVTERRGALLGAALTIARAWFAAGCPDPPDDVPRMGGFDDWRRVVGGVISHAGIDGFLASAAEIVAQADDEGPAWAAFLAAWDRWVGEQPTTVSALVQGLDRKEANLLDALPVDLANALEHPRSASQRIGTALRNRDGHRFMEESGEAIWVEAAERHPTSRAIQWRVCRGD